MKLMNPLSSFPHLNAGRLQTMAGTWWHEGELAVQRRAGVANPERLRTGVRDELPPHFMAFLAAQRFAVVATVDALGTLWCAMVPGWPGFAVARSPRQVTVDASAFEEAVLQQLRVDPRIGVLAFDPFTRRRIRVNGVASVEPGTVVIDVAETFGNCQQYIQQRPAAHSPSRSSSGLRRPIRASSPRSIHRRDPTHHTAAAGLASSKCSTSERCASRIIPATTCSRRSAT